MLHEIVTTFSIVYLQCAVMLRKYIVVKHQKAFGKSPTVRPNIVDARGRLVPRSFPLPCQSGDEYVPFLPSWGYAYAGLDHSDFFFNSKMHEIYEDCFFACVSKNIWLHKYIPLNPWAPTVFSTLLLCVNGSETERTVWRHYGIVERIQALGSDLGKNPRRAKQ